MVGKDDPEKSRILSNSRKDVSSPMNATSYDIGQMLRPIDSNSNEKTISKAGSNNSINKREYSLPI